MDQPAFEYNEYLSPLVDAHGRPQLSAAAASAFEAGDSATPDYEAASTSHRLGLWGLSGSGPNVALGGNLSALRSRCRNLIRNNAMVAGGVDALVSNLVGTDISPSWDLADSELKQRIFDLWTDSQEELDATGVYDFYGMTELVARAQSDAGECLARFRPRRMSDNLLVPLQIQLLEGDHLDASFDSQADNGNEIRMGIEWDKIGRRTAYHLFREHPGERYAYMNAQASERVRVPASEVLHVFRPLRIGQARGCPWLAPTLTKLREIDQLDDAVLVRKKVANLFGFFFKQTGNQTIPPGMAGGVGGKLPKDPNSSKPLVPMQPGLSVRLKEGEEVVFSDPPDVGDNYKDFIKQQLRMVAKGMGIMYEQLSGDLEGVTFSSIRAGVNEFRRLCEMLQARILVHQWCRPVVRRWLDTAVLSGAIEIPDYLENKRKYWRVTWHPDGWDYVDPVKDRLAEQMDIRNGIDSRTAKVSRRGRSVEQVDREIQADNARSDAAGLVYDTDPRKTNKSGLMQQAETQALMDGK